MLSPPSVVTAAASVPRCWNALEIAPRAGPGASGQQCTGCRARCDGAVPERAGAVQWEDDERATLRPRSGCGSLAVTLYGCWRRLPVQEPATGSWSACGWEWCRCRVVADCAIPPCGESPSDRGAPLA